MHLNDLTKSDVSRVEDALKPWRTIIVAVDDGLRLKHKETTAILFALITFTCFILWLYQPPLIATISFFSIILVILEQLLPTVFSVLYGSTEKVWSAEKGIRYKQICKEIVFYSANASTLYKWLNEQKLERPAIYLVIVSAVLSVIGYISYKISNIWLCYTMFLLSTIGRAYWYENHKFYETPSKLHHQ